MPLAAGYPQFRGVIHRELPDGAEFRQRHVMLDIDDRWQRQPDDIPSSPNVVYQTVWRGYGDWLGTDTISTRKRQ